MYYKNHGKPIQATAKHVFIQVLFPRSPNWTEAAAWYSKAIQHSTDQSSIYPNYTTLARLASMYHSGGNGLAKDPQRAGELYTEAAETAMVAMKGKLSTKYYMLAEEAWSEVELTN